MKLLFLMLAMSAQASAGPLIAESLAPSESAALIRTLEAQDSFNTALAASHFQFANAPTLEFLFESSSGASDYVSSEETERILSIGEHTTRVLDVYREQKRFFEFARIDGVRDLDTLLRFTLAFHDIGKSFAAQAGDKSQETVYSVPLAGVLMKAAGFTSREVELSKALIWSHQIIGSNARGLIAENTIATTDDPKLAAVLAIRLAAKQASLEPKAFFQLMKIVFVCDAASYETLRSRIFTEDSDGKLISTEAREIDELQSALK